jgi:hypothetical protein
MRVGSVTAFLLCCSRSDYLTVPRRTLTTGSGVIPGAEWIRPRDPALLLPQRHRLSGGLSMKCLVTGTPPPDDSYSHLPHIVIIPVGEKQQLFAGA